MAILVDSCRNIFDSRNRYNWLFSILAFSTIGKEVIVTKEINSIEATGQVKIDGEIWSATCEGTSIIPKGSMVKVIQIDGVKVIVEPIKEPTMQN